MTQPNIDYNSHIVTHAKGRGADLSGEEVESLNATLRSVQFVDASGNIAFTLGGGQTGDLDAALSIFTTGMGRTSTASTSTTLSSAGTTATERAIDTNRAAREGIASLKRRQAEELVQAFGSPWATSGSLTHAAFITLHNPELAARLRAEAGERP